MYCLSKKTRKRKTQRNVPLLISSRHTLLLHPHGGTHLPQFSRTRETTTLYQRNSRHKDGEIFQKKYCSWLRLNSLSSRVEAMYREHVSQLLLPRFVFTTYTWKGRPSSSARISVGQRKKKHFDEKADRVFGLVFSYQESFVCGTQKPCVIIFALLPMCELW